MLTVERLRELLTYDPETGIFRWRNNAGRYGRIPAGTIAGSINAEGYRRINVCGKFYSASHLVWFYVHGVWAPDQMDHKNRDTGDDRLCNLRPANGSQNKSNCGLYTNNTSGFRGVYFERPRKKWMSKIVVNGKRKWLGRFKTREEAFAAYCAAAALYHGEFANPEARQ